MGKPLFQTPAWKKLESLFEEAASPERLQDLLLASSWQDRGQGAKALFLMDILAWEALKEKIPSDSVLVGYSLGSLAAAVVAGALSPRWAFNFLRHCNEEFRQRDEIDSFSLLAVIGMKRDDILTILKETVGEEFCFSNKNHSTQHVFCLPSSRAEKARAALSEEALATRVLSGLPPIHTHWALPAIQASLASVGPPETASPEKPLLCHRTGQCLQNAQEVAQELMVQFSKPGDWHAVMNQASSLGVDGFVESGPGDILCKLVRWRFRSWQIKAFDQGSAA